MHPVLTHEWIRLEFPNSMACPQINGRWTIDIRVGFVLQPSYTFFGKSLEDLVDRRT